MPSRQKCGSNSGHRVYIVTRQWPKKLIPVHYMLAALLIFLGTYLVLAIGRLPGFRVDRTGAAIIGASLMIAFRILSLEEAFHAINYETLILLFGMMIVVANLRLSGFFAVISAWAVGTRSASHSDLPTFLPVALRKVLAMPPPTTS